MTYAELKTLLAGYLHRTDLTASIPGFITLAHARIMRDLKDPALINRYTDTMTADTRYQAIPTATRKLLDVQVMTSGGRLPVLPVSTTQMNSLNQSVYVGSPAMSYCLRGRTMEFWPILPAGAELEMLALDRLDQPAADDDTNDILTNNPNIYVYAAMMEACIFIQGDERLPVFNTAYTAEVERINEEAEDYELSGGPIQIMKLGISTP